jgi:hypothetical protein
VRKFVKADMMSDRIDQHLNGALKRSELEPRERAEADAARRAIREMSAFIGSRRAPDVTGAVMQRINPRPRAGLSNHSGALARAKRLMWMPRQITIRPAYAVLALVTAAVLVLAVPERPSDPRLFVQFRLEADAMNVHLAGSFTNWEPVHALHQIAPGVWTIAVPLPQGVHDYAFVVDGREWVADPYAPAIEDGFGGINSRLTILVPDAPRL